MAAKSTRDKILDTALALAQQESWEHVRLHAIADNLNITLNEVREHFREKADLTDAWFDRADASMLQEAAKPDFLRWSTRVRLQRLIMAWLTALAMHRRATREMICGKFEPGHIHYQFAGLLRVSRTVQWLREASQRDTELPWRAIEETGLTAIYLATFFYWMRDDSEQAVRTASFLEKLLTRAAGMARWVPGFQPTPPPGAVGQSPRRRSDS